MSEYEKYKEVYENAEIIDSIDNIEVPVWTDEEEEEWIKQRGIFKKIWKEEDRIKEEKRIKEQEEKQKVIKKTKETPKKPRTRKKKVLTDQGAESLI